MEENSIDIILIFPLSLLSLVILMIFVNIFVFIRKKFPIKVNCWFCNQWTKVPYHLRDSFECPSCLQYNGFNNDGGYNKLIPAQYDVSLNKSLNKQSAQYSPSNGLCQLCNNNQKLRVFQLANFIPLNDANYDTEIEHFQKQLDKAYKLCNRCENTLQTTIRKQHFLLGINLQKCASKGLSMMDLTQSTNGVSVELKRTYLRYFVYYAIVGFSLLNIGYFVMQNVEFSELPLSPYFLKADDFYNVYIKKYVISFPRVFQLEGILENSYISDIFVIMEVVWAKITDIVTSLTQALLFGALLTRTQFWLFLVEALLQFLWLIINPDNFKRNVFLLLVSLTMLSLELSYLSFIKVDVDLLSLPISILNILLMWFSHTAIKTKNRKHSSKSLKKKVKHSVAKKEIIASLPVETNQHCVTKQIVTNIPHHNQKTFNDTSTATTKGRIDRPVRMENLFGNLDVSLNKLHIGTGVPNRRSPVKTYPCPSPSLERPRPVVSPARFLINTPSTWGETSTFTTNNGEPKTFDFVQRDSQPFGNFGCNSSFYSPPLCNIGPQPQQYNRHLGSCCPRYSCGGVHFNSSYRPLINSEQLVYISPNYLQSGHVYEIFKQNFSSDIFDTSFKEDVNRQKYSENTNGGYNQFTKKFQ